MSIRFRGYYFRYCNKIKNIYFLNLLNLAYIFNILFLYKFKTIIEASKHDLPRYQKYGFFYLKGIVLKTFILKEYNYEGIKNKTNF